MIELRLSTNARSAMAEIDALIGGLHDKATLRAINRTVDAIATEANREVRKVYKVKASEVSRSISKKKAYPTMAVMSGSVTFRGRGLNLAAFAARAVNPWNIRGRRHRRLGGGVSVEVMVDGGRKLIRGAFIASSTRNNARGGGSMGITMVYMREGKSAYPIRSLRSVSVPQAIRNKVVDAAIRRVADATFRKTYDQQIVYLRTGRSAS